MQRLLMELLTLLRRRGYETEPGSVVHRVFEGRHMVTEHPWVQEFVTETCIGESKVCLELVLAFHRKPEYRGFYCELNGSGGWFYDQETGTVKVNLTQPVKTYIDAYVGLLGQEVPSDW